MVQLSRFLHLDSGLSRLIASADVTINGQTKTAVARYLAKDATLTEFVANVGTNLPIASTGTDPTLDVPHPLMETADKAVRFNAGKVYQAADASYLDWGADDVFFECVVRLPDDNVGRTPFGKYPATFPDGFWNLAGRPASFRFQAGDGVATAGEATINFGPDTHGTWVYICGFWDLSDTATTGMRMNGNGGAYTGASSHGSMTSVTSSVAKFTVGARSDFTNKWNTEFAYFAMWKSPGWFAGGATNTSQWDAIAKTRFSKLLGVVGEGGANSEPSVITRATPAHLDKVINESTGERRLFYVGNGWMRQCKRKEKTGGEFFKGFSIEPAKTNLLLNSEAFNLWTKINAADSHDSNQRATPDNKTNGDLHVVFNNAALEEHGFRQAVTLSTTNYTFSVFIKKEHYTWVVLRNSTIANGAVWFNLDTGAKGTQQSGVSAADIENWGGGWFRISMKFAGTAASHNLDIMSATADGSFTHSSSGTTWSFAVFGAMLEGMNNSNLAGSGPTTYIPTTTASVTRNRDSLRFPATGNTQNAGSVEVKMLSAIIADNSNPYLVEIGPNSGNREIMYQNGSPSGPVTIAAIAASTTVATQPGPADSIVDGEIHDLKIKFNTDYFSAFRDGVEGTPDTSGTLPTIDTGSITIGNSVATDVQQAGYLIADVRIHDAATAININTGISAETDAALTLTATKSADIGISAETDSAPAMTLTLVTPIAGEIDATLSLSAVLTASVAKTLKLDGVTVPVAACRRPQRRTQARTPTLMGGQRDRHQKILDEWEVETAPMTVEDAESLAGLVSGLWHVFPFDADFFSEQGLPPQSLSGNAIVGSGKYGSYADVTTSLQYKDPENFARLGGGAKWSWIGWRWDGSAWDHYIVLDDGKKWVDGVRNDAASTSWLTVTTSESEGTMTLTTGRYDDVVWAPWRLSTSHAAALATFAASAAIPAPHRLTAEGDALRNGKASTTVRGYNPVQRIVGAGSTHRRVLSFRIEEVR